MQITQNRKDLRGALSAVNYKTYVMISILLILKIRMSNRDVSEQEDPSYKSHDSQANVNTNLGLNFTQLWLQIKTSYPLSDRNEFQSLANNEGSLEKETKPVVILGKTYEDVDINDGIIEQDIYSKIWLTYRTGFEPIPKAIDGPQPLSFVHSMVFNRNPISSTFNNLHGLIDNDNFTTDVGWGCMIRTSQSLLANAYQLLLLGRDFKYESPSRTDHQKILDMFMDDPEAPFSLHNFIKVASALPLKVMPGQWFGPNAASLSIKRLCNNLYQSNGRYNVEVLISESSNLYDDLITKLLTQSQSITDALLILMPVRLGIDKVNPIYHASILQLLSLSQSVGIAGGKPSSSFYFFGSQGDDLLYLDPHYPQFVKSNASIYDTFHTSRYQKLNVSEMDPSMMIGILIKDANDYEAFKRSCVNYSNKILHFHPTAENIERRNSVNEFKRKNSDYVCVEAKDINKSEEYITVGGDFGDESSNLEGFVDIADELDSQLDQSYKNNKLDEDPINISKSGLENDI